MNMKFICYFDYIIYHYSQLNFFLSTLAISRVHKEACYTFAYILGCFHFKEYMSMLYVYDLIHSMLYQVIVSYPSHLICNLLNLCKGKVGVGEFLFSKVSSDCKASIPLSIELDMSFFLNR